MTTKLLILLLTGAVWLGACQTADEKLIGQHDPIRHDDFVYSVQRVVRQDSLGSLKPAGRFWIVTFRVENQAKRVDHAWLNTTAFVSSDGHTYENQPTIQQRLNQTEPFGWRENYRTPAGRTDSTHLVFDLPRSVQHPYLQVRGEVLMGDAFDGHQFERTKVRLF